MEKKKSLFAYSTQEIVLLAVLGVIFGVINVFLGALPQWGGALGGPLLSAALGGFVQISQVLGGYIVRRPGAATITMLINVATQFLAGNPAGIILFPFGLAQGLGAEIVFALGRYKKFNWWMMCFAGGMANIASQLMFVIMFGWDAKMGIFLASLPIAFVAGAIESGLIAFGLGKALDKTGLIASVRRLSA
jgi:energy-coupling factor transport system substrate-specific component